MRARVTSPNGGRRERPSEWLEAHLETQPGREPGTPPPVPAPPPGPLSARSYPRPHREPRGGSGRSPRATVVPPPRELPRGARTGAETRPGTRVGGRASARRTRAGGAHQFLVAPVVLVALPIQPLRQQLERDTRGVRVTTATGRPGGTGTRGRGTGGRMTDLVLLQLLHQHLRQRRTVRPGRLRLLRPFARPPSGRSARPPYSPAPLGDTDQPRGSGR